MPPATKQVRLPKTAADPEIRRAIKEINEMLREIFRRLDALEA